ncbi:MAG: hypothetical protein ABIR47_16855 [Candidatus Kapaibacterium sp.]
MSKPSLLHVPGDMLRMIRESAGWNRPRFARALARLENAEEDFTSVSSIERYEKRRVVPPRQVERYRAVIGEEIFDELLELYRKERLEYLRRTGQIE